MTIAIERPIETTAPVDVHETVARVRVYEGSTPDSMRIGLSRLATAHLDPEVLQRYLSSTRSQVGEFETVDASEAPFVSQSIELQPPLDEGELKSLGGLLVEDVFTDPQSRENPQAILLIDSRGNYAPTHPFDNGISVTGDRSSILS